VPETEVQERVIHMLFEECADPASPVETLKIGKEYPATWKLQRLQSAGNEESLWVGLRERDDSNPGTEIAIFRMSVPYFMREEEIPEKDRLYYRGRCFSIYFGTLMSPTKSRNGFLLQWDQTGWNPDDPLLPIVSKLIERFREIRAKFPEQEEKPIA
jgi:hypothetical protein